MKKRNVRIILILAMLVLCSLFTGCSSLIEGKHLDLSYVIQTWVGAVFGWFFCMWLISDDVLDIGDDLEQDYFPSFATVIGLLYAYRVEFYTWTGLVLTIVIPVLLILWLWTSEDETPVTISIIVSEIIIFSIMIYSGSNTIISCKTINGLYILFTGVGTIIGIFIAFVISLDYPDDIEMGAKSALPLSAAISVFIAYINDLFLFWGFIVTVAIPVIIALLFVLIGKRIVKKNEPAREKMREEEAQKAAAAAQTEREISKQLKTEVDNVCSLIGFKVPENEITLFIRVSDNAPEIELTWGHDRQILITRNNFASVVASDRNPIYPDHIETLIIYGNLKGVKDGDIILSCVKNLLLIPSERYQMDNNPVYLYGDKSSSIFSKITTLQLFYCPYRRTFAAECYDNSWIELDQRAVCNVFSPESHLLLVTRKGTAIDTYAAYNFPNGQWRIQYGTAVTGEYHSMSELESYEKQQQEQVRIAAEKHAAEEAAAARAAEEAHKTLVEKQKNATGAIDD